MWDHRELPDGARQSEADSELASEQPTENGIPESRLGRNTRRIKGAGHVCVVEGMAGAMK